MYVCTPYTYHREVHNGIKCCSLHSGLSRCLVPTPGLTPGNPSSRLSLTIAKENRWISKKKCINFPYRPRQVGWFEKTGVLMTFWKAMTLDSFIHLFDPAPNLITIRLNKIRCKFTSKPSVTLRQSVTSGQLHQCRLSFQKQGSFEPPPPRI